MGFTHSFWRKGDPSESAIKNGPYWNKKCTEYLSYGRGELKTLWRRSSKGLRKNFHSP